MKIDFFVEEQGWKWSPSELETFLGGTESWLVELATSLRSIGHSVRVFGNGPMETYRNIEYRHRKDCIGMSDVAVVWNHPNGFPSDASARKVLYWANGVEPWAADYLPFYDKVDKIVAMSEFQARELPEFLKDKITVIPGGVDPEEFNFPEPIERIKNQCLYSSSWDRGLERILFNWPYLKSRQPEFKLHITYGRSTARKLGIDLPDLPDLPDVTIHENLSRRDQARLFCQSDMLLFANRHPRKMAYSLYLTALKAQRVGCIPVTTPHVAVDEKLYGGVQVPVGQFANKLLELSFSEEKKQAVRERMSKFIVPSWLDVAREWEKLF